MSTLVFQIYDAFGDWISSNGMIRHLSEMYDEVYLIHDTPVVVPFTMDMFKDNPKIIPMEGEVVPGYECDVIDVRVNEIYPHPGNNGKYFNRVDKFGDEIFSANDNASNFYSSLGLDPKLRISSFDYLRDLSKENALFDSVNPSKDYSIICEMDDGMIDRSYVKEEEVNIHRLTDNFMHTLKLIENAKEVHLVENSIALFVYHMQSVGKMDKIPINFHVYSRKEPHRRCDGPDCDNPFLNMFKYPRLDNWNFIWQ